MFDVRGYAAYTAASPLAPFSFTRRDVGPSDVLVEILYCGVCHSDLHQARDEWGGSIFPMVPGHEIVGRVTRVGTGATRFSVGDLVGVGVFVDSCRSCTSCREGLEQYCDGHVVLTYNGLERDERTPTYGGYSTHIVVDEACVLRMPANLDPRGVAPLLCAGITTYSPLRHWNVAEGQRVGIIGLGGLGHMAVKFAAAFGADVTVFSTSAAKAAGAKRFGARDLVVTSRESAFKGLKGSFDFLLDTVSAPHDVDAYLGLLARDATLCLVGIPPEMVSVQPFSVIGRRRQLAGSMIGGIRETQEMLDFCGRRGIVSDVEVIAMSDINTAYERMMRADVRYRFVIDLATL